MYVISFILIAYTSLKENQISKEFNVYTHKRVESPRCICGIHWCSAIAYISDSVNSELASSEFM